VWKIGYPLVFAYSRFGLIALVALPALLLCGLELRRIWSADEHKEAPDAAPA